MAMRSKLLLSFILLFTVTATFAQKQVFYFKYNGAKVAQADSSDFVRIVSPPDSGSTYFNVTEYYRNAKPKFMGKSSTIDPIVPQGQCVSFYENGKRAGVINYVDGFPFKDGYLYYTNGILHTVMKYDTARVKPNQDNFKIITCQDTTGKPLVQSGNGHYADYDLASKAITQEGDVKDSLRNGEWKGSYTAEKVTFKDTYVNGVFTSGVSTTAAGKTYTYTSKQQSPEFTGGQAAFVNYIKSKLKIPAALKAKAMQTFISFTVSKDGKISNALMLGTLSPELDKAVIAAVNSSPLWKPRIDNGLPIDTSWGIPLVFNAPAAKKPAK